MPLSQEKFTVDNILPGCSATATSSTNSAKEDNCCVVCLDSRKAIILVPCGHYAFCRVCALEITECPICRARVEKRVKVFES